MLAGWQSARESHGAVGEAECVLVPRGRGLAARCAGAGHGGQHDQRDRTGEKRRTSEPRPSEDVAHTVVGREVEYVPGLHAAPAWSIPTAGGAW